MLAFLSLCSFPLSVKHKSIEIFGPPSYHLALTYNRVVRERKQRRKQWAQNLTAKTLPKKKNSTHKTASQIHEESHDDSVNNINSGMLPEEIVKFLAARETKVFTSESEDEKPEKKPAKRKRRLNTSGLDLVVLSELPPALCVQNSLDFLKMRKMQVSRSSSVLDNSDKALRLLSKSCLRLAKVDSERNAF